MKAPARGTPNRIPLPRPRRTDAKGCWSKHLYADAEQARAHILLFPAAEQPTLRPYLCPDCGGTHLGHFRERGAGR